MCKAGGDPYLIVFVAAPLNSLNLRMMVVMKSRELG